MKSNNYILVHILILISFVGMYSETRSQQVYFNEIYDYFGEQETGFSILAVNGGYYVAGAAKDSSSWQRIEILHVDSGGVELWKKSYGKQGNQYYPGIGGSFIETQDGGFALGGSVLKSTGDSDAMLYKFDSSGDTLWTKTYGDSLFQIVYKCQQTNDGGYILIGSTNNGTDSDVWLIKTDADGYIEWQSVYGGSNNQIGYTIDICDDQGYIIGGVTWSGSTGYDAYIIKTDSMGNVQWTKTYGGAYSDCGANIIQTTDGEYIFAFCINELVPPNLNPNFTRNHIYKLDSLGTVIWTRPFGPLTQGGGNSFNGEFHELSDGSFFIAGQLIDAQLSMRGWVLKISSQGDSIWDRRYDRFDESDDRFLNAVPTDDGGFIAVGDNYYYGMSDTGMLAGNRQNLWVVKVDSCGCAYSGCDTTCSGALTGILDLIVPNIMFGVYPNPTDGIISLTNLPEESTEIKVYSVVGVLVQDGNLNVGANEPKIDLSGLPEGVYFIQLENRQGKCCKKIVKL